ncbi:MAG TPA: carboxypeptidase, partial [Allosphingosinicella sp.]
QRGRASLLDTVDLVFVPIFNVDGHERTSPFNRPNQRGPRSQGWRTTARNINLNRAYLKADSPEMQAMIGLIRRVDPVLFFDIHVTDGVDYQYDITYGFQGREGRYAQSPAIGRWLDTVLRPNMDRALSRAGHIPSGLIFAMDDRDPAAGIVDFAAQPRLSHAYGDFARVPTVLVENHSLKPYRQRVLGTYVLIEEALRLAGANEASLRQAIAADRASRPNEVILAWRPSEQAVPAIPWRGIAHETYQSPISGRQEVRWLGRPQSSTMRVLVQEPSLTVALPRAWWVPASRPEVIERLRLHGVQFETLSAPRTVTLEMARLVNPQLQAASEGHVPMRVAGTRREQRAETFSAGSVRVPADQPLALVAAALLEPESPDSLLAWGFFPDLLQRTEYIEGYAVEPMAQRMLAADPALASAFQAALAGDPELASDADRRLQWFYERSAYYDDRYLLYPVGRELN